MITKDKELTSDCYRIMDCESRESYEKRFDAALREGDKDKAHRIVREWIGRAV
jgi:hypothetical protein